MAAKQTRKASMSAAARPAWSISRPARNGPTKFATAGAIASQLNTRLSSVGVVAERPTWRCSAITVAPVAPPVSSAATHMAGKTGNAQTSPAPSEAAITDSSSGRLKPWRSAKRPAGSARKTWVSANSAISTPTAAAL